MIAAAVRYFIIVFAVGFVLGTIRTLWLAPILGATWAVVCELPVMLAVSIIAARHVVRRFPIRTGREALLVGVLAFALLMAAEAVLGVFAFGERLSEWATGLLRVPGILGLIGQIVSALIPALLVVRSRATRHLP